MSNFDHIIQIRQPFFCSRGPGSLKAHAERSCVSTVLWVWVATIVLLGVPAAVMTLSWIILRS